MPTIFINPYKACDNPYDWDVNDLIDAMDDFGTDD